MLCLYLCLLAYVYACGYGYVFDYAYNDVHADFDDIAFICHWRTFSSQHTIFYREIPKDYIGRSLLFENIKAYPCIVECLLIVENIK